MKHRPKRKSSNHKTLIRKHRNTGEKFCDLGLGKNFIHMQNMIH